MKLSKLTLIAVSVMLAQASFALPQEGFAYTDKNTGRHVEVGVSDTKTNSYNASIAIVDTVSELKNNSVNNQFVSFKKIAGKAGSWFVSDNVVKKDSSGVYVVRMYNMSGGIYNLPFIPDHSGLGRMSFAQVGSQDVWYGDWADVPAGATNGSAGTNYSVYYAGTGATTNLPTSGTATYDVKGINNHVAHNTAVLSGTFTADFARNSLVGELQRTGLTVGVNANINAQDASFKGDATANGVAGTTQGQFFGNQGAALAGVATFGVNSELNTAFGGVKR